MSSQVRAIEIEQQAKGSRVAPFVPLILFCLAHFFVDLYSIALGVLQPALIERFGISLTQAGFLGGVLVFSSSLMQPVYGFLSDRFHTRMFTVLAPALAAVFISSLGLSTGYTMLLAMAWMGGAGVAAFHPQATANATLGLNVNRGRAMAIFISAGTLGLAVGPTYFSFAVQKLGLDRLPLAALPGIVVSVVLYFTLRFAAAEARVKEKFNLTEIRAAWRQLTILYFLVFIRSIVQITFAQFLPLYLNMQRGYSLKTASYITSLYLVFGALGGFAGGNFADRFGGRRIILLSFAGSLPLLQVFVHADGWLSVAGLVTGGLLLLFTIPVNVVMGQQLVPSQAGTISALMMGFAWGMAGLIFIPLTGWVADHYSLQNAFAGLVLFPAAGFLLALKLKR